MKFQVLIKINTEVLRFVFLLKNLVFILIINVKMPTIVCILTFIIRINTLNNYEHYEISCPVVHEKVL